MADFKFHLIDNNTGEEVYASEGFSFDAVPTPDHRINDPELRDRYGGPAIVNRVEQTRSADGVEVNIYIDGNEERFNGETQERTYRPMETN